MNKLLIVFFSFVIGLNFAYAKERILSFDVEITPDPNGFLVEEKIKYQFTSRKHGIYRDIITKEKRELNLFGKKFNPNYFIDLTIERVRDEHDNSRFYTSKNLKKGRRLKIGQKGIKVDGIQHYHIKYYVKRAVRFFDIYDEIYWNVTGNYWQVPIDQATIKVRTPYGLQVLNDGVKVYQGYTGVKDEISAKIDSDSVSAATYRLKRREGMSIAIPFAKGFFNEYSFYSKMWWLFKSNFILCMAILLPLFTFLFFFILHKYKGKELYKLRTVPVQYDPPEGLSPAEVGTLMDDEVHISDIVSIVYDLATRGYLEIQEIEKSGFSFFNKGDYNITILDKDTKDLLPFEKLFITKLRKHAGAHIGKTSIRVSELSNNFYSAIEDIRHSIYSHLSSYKFYFGRPDKIRNKYNGFAMVFYIMLYGGFIMGGHVADGLDLFFLMPSVILCFFITKFFAKIMPKKTRRGFKVYRHVMGFKEFIERVEKKKLKLMIKADPTLFERTLPYAVAMGLADEWGEKFEDIALTRPNWYHGMDSNFNSRSFMRSIGGSMSSISSSIASAPRSSGSSGSFGGGGFSGGGSGGGGGGSW
jgi:uncharacterized membrane protein YgcG